MQMNRQKIFKNILLCFCVFSIFLGTLFSIAVKSIEAAEKPVIRVGYLDEYDPYSNFKHKKHIMSGFVKFLVNRIEKDANVKTRCRPYLNEQQMLDDLKLGKIDVVFPVYGDKQWAKGYGISISKPIDKSELILIFKGNDRPNLTKRIGLLDKSVFEKRYLESSPLNSLYYSYPDIVFAADAIKEGAIDSVLVQSTQYIVLEKYLSPSLRLNKKVFADNIEVCLGLAPESAYLTTINQVLANISQEEMHREIIRASNDSSQFTWKDFVVEHIVEIAWMVAGFIFFLIICFVRYYQVTRRTAAILLDSKLKTEEILEKETNLRQALEKAMFKAEHDSMTGLLNKGSFEAVLESHLNNPHMACIVFDIDNFKNVNDTYGHDIGDQVIKAVASAIKTSFRDTDAVARIGGDEFAIIIKEITADKRDIIIQRLTNVREILTDKASELPNVTLSVGIAFADEESRNNPKVIFLHADSVLYEVKDNGRDGFIFYN